MLARAAKLVYEEAQMTSRMQALSQMLASNGDNMQGETLDIFEKLFREMKEKVFRAGFPDSNCQTIPWRM